jgi:hypothetical protein
MNLTRRELFIAGAIAAFASFARRTGLRPRLVDFKGDRFEPYGFHRMKGGRVYLDGKDVTRDHVFYASEAFGELRGYALDGNGRPIFNANRDCAELGRCATGHVVILLPEELES